jgi:hypothetical protein
MCQHEEWDRSFQGVYFTESFQMDSVKKNFSEGKMLKDINIPMYFIEVLGVNPALKINHQDDPRGIILMINLRR